MAGSRLGLGVICGLSFGCWLSPRSERFPSGSAIFLPPETPASPNSNLNRIELPRESQVWLMLVTPVFNCCNSHYHLHIHEGLEYNAKDHLYTYSGSLSVG